MMEIKTAKVNGIEWKYTVSDGKATLAEHAIPGETAGEIVIPSELDGFPVTSIGESAFVCCSSLKTVFVAPGDAERVNSLCEFPDGVRFVEKKA